MTVRSRKNRLIKLAIQFGCALIVMVLIISGMEKPRLPIKIEIRAKISQDDVWRLTYEDTRRLFKKRRKRTRTIKVSGTHTFQTISFRLRSKTRYHWFGLNEHREIILTLKASAAVELKPLKRRKVFIFRDSFIKYYPHFYQVHFKPFVQLSNRRFDPGLIEKGKPSIVIWEIIERASDILLN
jgi:hypothetical protein